MKNEYKVKGEVTELYVKCKGELLTTLISTRDLERVKEFPNSWYAYYVKRRDVYIVSGNLPHRSNEKRKRTLLTRWIVEPPVDKVVDHINHDTLDNRRENLRVITDNENQQNRSKSNRNNKSSRHVGVHYRKESGVWHAYVDFNKVRTNLGLFKSEEEAINAVVDFRKRYLKYSKEFLSMDLQHPDVTSALRTGYPRDNQPNKEDE